MSEDQLARDHAELDTVLAELFSALEEEDIDRSFDRMDLFWARLAMHIRAENIHLFPALLEAVETKAGSAGAGEAPELVELQESIETLRRDHDFFMVEWTAAVKKLRDAKRNDQAVDFKKMRQDIDAVVQRLDQHNTFEETQVYPLVTRLLAPPGRDELNAALAKELGRLPARFQ